jgi:hypothetical protein
MPQSSGFASRAGARRPARPGQSLASGHSIWRGAPVRSLSLGLNSPKPSITNTTDSTSSAVRQNPLSPLSKALSAPEKNDRVWIDPTDTFRKRQPKALRDSHAVKSLRAIRLESPDGTVSVLLTNLFNSTVFPAKSIVDLYFRHWAIESHYRDEYLLDTGFQRRPINYTVIRRGWNAANPDIFIRIVPPQKARERNKNQKNNALRNFRNREQ